MKNIAGQRFGRVTAISYSHTNNDKKACWKCVCDCGALFVASGKSLRNGNTKSCGCLKIELIARMNYKHGFCANRKKPAEYHIWHSMIERCRNTNNKDYPDYGGRGIHVSDSWSSSFNAFITDMGRRPSKAFWLDRIDNNKGYSKDNCLWRSISDQQNNKRSNKFLSWDDRSMTVAQWGNEVGIKATKITMRLRRGWTIERALTTH